MVRNGQETWLFVVACPPDQLRLAFDEELRAIMHHVDGKSIHVIPALAATYGDLRESLRRNQPHVAHVVCHGTRHGGLLLSDGHGSTEHVPADTVAGLFAHLRHNLRLAVINACHSHLLARRLAPIVGAAIGMNDAIVDHAAVRYAPTFYALMADGVELRKAHDLAVNDLGCIGAESVPVLYTSSDTPNDPHDAPISFTHEGGRRGVLDLLILAGSSAVPPQVSTWLARELPDLSHGRVNGRDRELRLIWSEHTLSIAARPSLYSENVLCQREVAVPRPGTTRLFYYPRTVYSPPCHELTLDCREREVTVVLRRRGERTGLNVRLNLY